MKRTLILIVTVFITFSCYAQINYSWGEKGLFLPGYKQEYNTWCLFASLSTIFGIPQCRYATEYYVSFRNADMRTNCCDISKGSQFYTVCTDKQILLKDVVKFINKVRGFGGVIWGPNYVSLVPGHTLEPGKKYRGTFMFPTIGIIGTGSVQHAVVLLFIQVLDYGTEDVRWLYEYIDPFTGTRNYKIENDMYLVM